ncbi:hypothetical protein [Aristophania vespae]|uniref:hypothetical protein n=1 Tax=Aristophania vespae TaxID=2697033 RepID=UPI00235180C3|nr:hypothetical protein [Aristophania vespae]
MQPEKIMFLAMAEECHEIEVTEPKEFADKVTIHAGLNDIFCDYEVPERAKLRLQQMCVIMIYKSQI